MISLGCQRGAAPYGLLGLGAIYDPTGAKSVSSKEEEKREPTRGAYGRLAYGLAPTTSIWHARQPAAQPARIRKLMRRESVALPLVLSSGQDDAFVSCLWSQQVVQRGWMIHRATVRGKVFNTAASCQALDVTRVGRRNKSFITHDSMIQHGTEARRSANGRRSRSRTLLLWRLVR
jgi:hypothetical protein